MSSHEAMICPECGVAMNHHADKPDSSVAPDQAEGFDAMWGGVMEEAHTCPECGRVGVRVAADG